MQPSHSNITTTLIPPLCVLDHGTMMEVAITQQHYNNTHSTTLRLGSWYNTSASYHTSSDYNNTHSTTLRLISSYNDGGSYHTTILQQSSSHHSPFCIIEQ